MSTDEVKKLLERHAFTRGLSASQIDTLAACAHVARFREQAVVFREGQPADTLYLIVHGRVALEQALVGTQAVQLESLTGGDILGLSWLYPAGRWVLEARATEPVETVALDAACVRGHMDADPPFGLAIAKLVIHQLYQRLERVRLQRLDVYRNER